MSEVLLLDPIGGIAGDMFLALALDLGVPVADLERGLAPLGLAGWRFEVSRSARQGISGTHLDVAIDAPASGHAHRPWVEIRTMIERSGLPAAVRDRALAVFGRLAAAEAKVHGTTEDQVEFHEVGAVDSIVDIVGAAVAVELLGTPDIYCAPPPLGSGMTRSAHGALPIPPPATLEVLADRSVRFEGRGELTTPTGASIVAALTRDEPFPEIVIERVGYGVGTADFADRPNVLRGTLGARAHGGDEGTWVLEANLDDASPQLIAWALDALMAQGALDAWITPATMKKGRPGHVLGALVPGPRRAAFTELMLRETTSIGVRAYRVERFALERRFETVQTAWGEVRVKIARLGGADVNAWPEYEDCARLARERGVPLKDVLAAALAALPRNR